MFSDPSSMEAALTLQGSSRSGIHIEGPGKRRRELTLEEAMDIANDVLFDGQVFGDIMRMLQAGVFNDGAAEPLRDWLAARIDDGENLVPAHVSLYVRTLAAEEAIQNTWFSELVGAPPGDPERVSRALTAFGQAEVSIDPDHDGSGPRLVFLQETLQEIGDTEPPTMH